MFDRQRLEVSRSGQLLCIAAAEALLKDQEDLAEFSKRADGPTLSYEQFLNELKSLGKI
ncbi:MAG: hypothetical protein WD273_02675 [Trueperaceae bacterium]